MKSKLTLFNRNTITQKALGRYFSKTKTPNIMKNIGQNILVASLGGALTLLGAHFLMDKEVIREVVVNQTPPVQQVSTPALSTPDFRSAAEQSLNAVVHIKTKSFKTTAPVYDPFQNFFFGPQQRAPRQQEVAASGSGVILESDGYIVTNNHVINGASEIEVTLNDKRTFKAEIIGSDPSTDIALLKIDGEALPYINAGNSDQIQVGEWVLAVGNPFNLTSTVTAGIVSAKARNINILQEQFAIESFIQTDAAVNPGNSGGALVNANGELIGINTAIASNTGSYAGYSFAVPINMVKKVTKDLMEYGRVQRAFIGVVIQEVNDELAEELNLNALKGVYVSDLAEDGAAEDAGIEKGDIITHVGNIEVNSVPSLQEQIGRFSPGDQVTISLLRDNKVMTKTLTLRNKNGNTEKIVKEKTILGAAFGEVSDELKEKLNIKSGVQILDIGSGKLMRERMPEGFVITHVDKEPIQSVKELDETLSSKKGGVLIEGVFPNGSKGYYAFGLE